jgi:hypothetical protein
MGKPEVMISSATSSIPLEVTGFVPLEVTGFVPPTMTGFVPPKMTGQGNCKARIGLKIKVELILASLGARPCAPTNPDFFVGAQELRPRQQHIWNHDFSSQQL